MTEAAYSRVWEELEPLVHGNIPDEVGTYIERLTPGYQERVADGLNQLRERSTPAFRANIGAVVGAAMPVSYQESNYVRHALDQYEGQYVPQGPHRLAGYLNRPRGTEPEVANATRHQMDRFIAEIHMSPSATSRGARPRRSLSAVFASSLPTASWLSATKTPCLWVMMPTNAGLAQFSFKIF